LIDLQNSFAASKSDKFPAKLISKLISSMLLLFVHVKHVHMLFFIVYPIDICQMSRKYVQRLTICKISTFYRLFVHCP